MKLYTIALLALASFYVSAQSTLTVTNLNDSGPGSLRQQVFNSNSGDFIRFNPSLLASGSDTLFLNFPIIVDNGIHITGLFRGGDTLFISGHDSTQIFYMDFSGTPGHEVYLDSMAIIDAKQYAQDGTVDNQNGGAILALGLDSLKITNSAFKRCRVSGNGNGGAIFSRYTNLIIENSSFTENHTDSILPQFGIRGLGGAIYCGVGKLLCRNTSFKVNFSGDGGGAAYLGAVEFEFENCTFVRNKTSGYDPSGRVLEGGALYTFNCQSASYLNCWFLNNNAFESGGAIRMTGGFGPTNQLTISGCTFASNKAGKRGGALSLIDQDLVLLNSTFHANTTFSTNPVDGGSALDLFGRDIEVTNSTFMGNASAGGAGTVRQVGATVDITNSTFFGNSFPSNSAEFVGVYDNNRQDTISTSSTIFVRSAGYDLTEGLDAVNSLGHNIFSDNPNFRVTTDQTNVDSLALALEPLAMNGGFTPTMLPGPTSVALNMGNPTDFSDAQNGPVFGRRDVGAAERAVVSYDTTLACSPVSWWGSVYNSAGVYTDTAFNANSIDSVGILVLNLQDTTIFDLDGTLYSREQDTNTTYQWVDCDNNWAPIPGATSRNFLPPSNGNYAIILTNQNCEDTSSCFSYNRFNIYEAATDAKWIAFYPNPTTGKLNIDFTSQRPRQLELIDIWGRIVLTQPLQSGVSSIQLPELSAGTYIMRWTSATGKIQVDRIVIRE